MDILSYLMDAAGGISGCEGTLDRPDFDGAGRLNDWRNHVPRAVKDAWPHLSTEARVVAYVTSREAANAEDWW